MLIDQEKPANSAEASVIGSMLIEPKCVPELMQELTAEDFTDGTLRLYFETIRRNFLQRIPLDIVTVVSSLGVGEEAQNRHAAKMVDLMTMTPTAANCLYYARIIRDRRQLRQIQAACAAAAQGKTLEDARELLTKAAGLLVQKQADRDKGYGDLIAELVSRQDKTEPDYLDWGIPALNEKLHAGPGRFVILGADSSVGKTALALQFALQISKRKRVGFFSYETTLGDATDRLIANDADVSLGRLKGKHLTDEEMDAIMEAGERSDKRQLRILETARYTVEDIRAKTIARGFQVIFVDYVQMIPTRRKDRYEAVTEISIGLHALAQELGVTVIGLSQVTVPDTDKKGRRRYISKEDLRESRQLKQDADVILLLDLVDPAIRSGDRVLQIEKNRDGPLAHLFLSFDPSRMRFSYMEPPESDADRKSRERCEKMDAKREAQREKELRAEEQKKLQGSLLEGWTDVEEGDLPFV
jgi:replicative DNA helicase